MTPSRSEELLLSSDLGRVIPAAPPFRRRLRAGELVRVRRGVYLDAARWAALDEDARYVELVRGTALGCTTLPVLSHESAAALWGLPLIGGPPTDVHVLVDRATGGRSDPGIRRHALGLTDADMQAFDGLLVTTLARTVVDLAATASVYTAVAVADAALWRDPFTPVPRLTRDELFTEWERMMPYRGFARARRVLEFAESGAASAGESASRVSIAVAGFPAPALQRHFVADGRDAWADFYWDEVDAIAECDGKGKYLDARLRAGRTIEQVVMDEKYREDALRRQVRGFTRWGYSEALSPQRLRLKLLELGLQPGRSRLRGR